MGDDIVIGYPGNGEYPKPYEPVVVVTQSLRSDRTKRKGAAYWSGNRWQGLSGFRIGLAKVIKWEWVK